MCRAISSTKWINIIQQKNMCVYIFLNRERDHDRYACSRIKRDILLLPALNMLHINLRLFLLLYWSHCALMKLCSTCTFDRKHLFKLRKNKIKKISDSFLTLSAISTIFKLYFTLSTTIPLTQWLCAMFVVYIAAETESTQ